MAWCCQATGHYLNQFWANFIPSCSITSPQWDKQQRVSFHFHPRPVLAFWYCRCLRLSVCVSICVCINHVLVRAITHHPFKVGSPNLDHRCKRPWLRSPLFCFCFCFFLCFFFFFFFWGGGGDWPWQGQIELQSQNLPHCELVHAITHHQLKLQFPNLEQKSILALFRPLPILGLIEIDFQFIFISNFKPRPNWAFYVHHWHSLVRPASLIVGRIERILREWTNSKNSHWNNSLA